MGSRRRLTRTETTPGVVRYKVERDVVRECFFPNAMALAVGAAACTWVLRAWPEAVKAVTCLMAVWAASRSAGAVKSEAVVLMRGIGIQMETRLFYGRTKKVFTEKMEIDAVWINEAVTRVDIFYYLCFALKCKENMLICFPTLQPGVDSLTDVYREAREFFPPKI
mmetsp:Transcript_1171/g.2696  ORF Transcript_1171/g.2696 Transcript_1171/m.2696 type:complete len:166 (+) Transcript_1171:136-633(+)